MKKEKSKQKETKGFGKTYSIRFRFWATVIFAMLAITFFVGGLSIYEVDNYILQQSKNFVGVTCSNEGERIDNSLKNMEKSVKIMASYLMEFFDSEEDVTDRELQKEVIKSAELMFVDVAKHTSTADAVSYYFRFDPAIADSRAGLFYSKLDGGDEFISLAPTDLSLYDRDDVEHVGWFWQPYESKKPVWMKPYYNQNNDIMMISYVIPMYYGDRFIGVVGMDFDYMALENRVNGIRVYENGRAHLELDGVIISDTDPNVNEIDYLRVSKSLVNGMSLVLSASYDDIRHIRYEIATKIFVMVVVLCAIFTLIVTFVVKKISDPLKKLANAATKLADGNYDMEIEHSNAREIKQLSAAFENLAVRLREREELLHISANRDSLTGLRNTTSYSAWVAQFDKKIESGQTDFGVVMLDLNDLKRTNDVYGHEVGNALIKASAKIISDVFKRSPVFRIGGDEFVAVLQNSDLENRDQLFELLVTTCKSTYVADTQEHVSIAYGFSVFDKDKDVQFADVFNRADNAMYENKRRIKSEN